jgi:hypothetical protein
MPRMDKQDSDEESISCFNGCSVGVIALASIASVPAAQTPKRPHYHWFVFFQFWPGTRPLESDYAKYIKEADDNRGFVKNQIQVQP